MATTREIKNLDTIMDGGLNERFNMALKEVLRNIYDPNTEPTKSRQINLIVKIKPDKTRTSAEFTTDVQTKTAPPVALTQMVLLNCDDDGNVTAQEITNQVPGQIDMDGKEIIPSIVKFKTSQEG